MEPEKNDRSFPLFDKVPLPPVMIQQLDMILTLGILVPLNKQVLEDFQKVVLENRPRSWMTIYLITFMSLHSCAKVSDENYKNARKQGLRVMLISVFWNVIALLTSSLPDSDATPFQTLSLSGIMAQMSSYLITTTALSPVIHSNWIGNRGTRLPLLTSPRKTFCSSRKQRS